MRILVIGGAGHVGSIIRDALETEHDCRYLDIKPVPGAADRTTVAGLDDDEALRAALCETDVVINTALGSGRVYPYVDGPPTGYADPDAAFDVNLKGMYRVLFHGLELGVRRFVQSSSMSVYRRGGRPYPVHETQPMDGWTPYRMSKRLAEELCSVACMRYPDATIVSLRLMLPQSAQHWPPRTGDVEKPLAHTATGPRDLCRLYLAAVQCDKPGFHPLNTTGEVTGADIPYDRAKALLGWQPRGE